MTRALLLATLALAGCAVGPDYKAATPPQAPRFKELAGWKPSEPRDDINRGAWWEIFDDPELNSLESQVAITNQNVKAAEAGYRQAEALVQEARSNLLPQLDINGGAQRQSEGGANFGGTTITRTNSTFTLEGSASWDLDVWGKIRRQVESSAAAAQVGAADLANALLSAQATLAIDYFELRGQDSLNALLTRTVREYTHALQITQNQYNAGTSSRADVVTAQALLQSTQALQVAVAESRQQFEHAIAVLAGRAPVDVTIPVAELASDVPVVPAGVPSALLERRPDIAAAERTMQEENALIGVAVAAYYPDITISALFGYAGNPLGTLFRTANQVWSLGASGTEIAFQGGFQQAAVAAAHAEYDQSVASYRQTVLSAFQQVEDQLVALHVLQDQAAAEALAVASTRRAVDVTLNEYTAGTVAYTSVITEQTLLLTDEQTALTIAQNRLVASATLIEALGGGWQANDLPGRGHAPDEVGIAPALKDRPWWRFW